MEARPTEPAIPGRADSSGSASHSNGDSPAAGRGSVDADGTSSTSALLLLLLVAALLYLPELGAVDFHREEGRRVLPAREMLASGDFVLPTLWGEPYLSKPPGIFWLQALAQTFAGGLSEVAARLVSVFATLATALGLFALGRRLYGASAGLYAGLLYLLATESLTKGRLAEIEAPLALAVFAATGLWWLGRSSWVACLGSGLALAAALLLKGPAALVFFLGPPIALAVLDRAPRLVLSPRLFVPLLLGAGLASLWVVALFDSVGRDVPMNAWTGQVGGQGGRTLAEYASERGSFLLGTLFAFAPAAWLLFASAGTAAGRSLARAKGARMALAAAASGWLFFLVFPGTSVRYVFPALPFVALAAGVLFARLDAGQTDEVFTRRIDWIAKAVGALALVLGLACVVAFFVDLGDIGTDVGGATLGLMLVGTGVWIWRTQPALRPRLTFLLVPLLVGGVLVTQVEPSKQKRHVRQPQARALDAALGDGDVLHIAYWANFNALLYVDHVVRFAPEWQELPTGAWLFVRDDQLEDARTRRPGTEEVLHTEIFGQQRALLRLGPRP